MRQTKIGRWCLIRRTALVRFNKTQRGDGVKRLGERLSKRCGNFKYGLFRTQVKEKNTACWRRLAAADGVNCTRTAAF